MKTDLRIVYSPDDNGYYYDRYDYEIVEPYASELYGTPIHNIKTVGEYISNVYPSEHELKQALSENKIIWESVA